MKRFAILVLSLLVVISMSACTSSAANKQAKEDVKKVLGDPEQLSMNFEEIKGKLGNDIITQTSDSNDSVSKNKTEIVLGNGIALYYSVIEQASETESGKDYVFKITVIHFGNATESNNTYKMRFIGANIALELIADEVDAVRTELLEQLNDAEFDGDEVALMRDLLNGKQLYAECGSSLWEMYSEVGVEVEATYDPETNSFIIQEEPEYDEMYDQYSYEIKDFGGRVKQRIYYKVDEAGTKWITEDYTFTYLPDGNTKVYSVFYWEFTTKIQDEWLTIENEETGYYKPLNFRSYFEDGTTEAEQYYDDNDNYVVIHYDNDGAVTDKRILEKGPDGRTIYEEEYYVGTGKLWNKYFETKTTATREEYYDNGFLASSRTFDTTREDEEGLNPVIQSINGFEDGSKTVYEYHENGEYKSITSYSPSGEITSILRFDENGNQY